VLLRPKGVVVLCHERVLVLRGHDAVPEMEEGPSEAGVQAQTSNSRKLLQSETLRWRTLRLKGVIKHVMYGLERRTQVNHR
jgi:hypothetical protein